MNWSTDAALDPVGHATAVRGGLLRAPGWALTGSAVLHLAVVLALGAWSVGPSDEGAIAGASPRAVVRWIAAEAGPPEASGPLGVPNASVPESPAAPSDSSDSPVEPQRPATQPLAPPPEPTVAEPAEALAASRPAPVVEPVMADGAVDGYLPRRALSVPPAPLAPIVLAWPAGMTVLGRQTAIFTVFIDETGTVRRMVADGPTLLPTLEAAARDTFTASAFSPGQVGGQAVRSMIRVEVVFDVDTPVATVPQAPMPTVVSRQNL